MWNSLVAASLLLAAAPGLAQTDEGTGPKTVHDLLRLNGSRSSQIIESFARTAVQDNNRAALPDLWALLATHNRITPPDWSIPPLLVSAICRLGTDADLEKILDLCDREPSGYRKDVYYLAPLSHVWISREVDELAKGPAPLMPSLPTKDILLPAHLTAAPHDLQDAWRLYTAAKSEFPEKLRWSKDKECIYFQKNEAVFYRAVGDFLRGKNDDVADSIGRFEWGGACGTGSEQLYQPKYRTLFMALLKARQYRPALGALLALGVTPDVFSHSSDDGGFAWKRRFIEFCGVDWEALYVGAMVDGRSDAYLNALTVYGSARTARCLLQLCDLANIDARTRARYLSALGPFLTPSGTVVQYHAGWSSGADTQRKAADSVPDELQKMILRRMSAEIRPDVSRETADAVCRMFVKLCRPETKEALRRALSLPFLRVREMATVTLEAMGEEAPPQPQLGSVRFRVLLDGQPLRDTKLEHQLRFGQYGTLMGSLSTGHDGTLSLDRGYFADVTEPIRGIQLSTPKSESLPGVWFRVSVPRPGELDSVTDVYVVTGPLTLKITPNHGPGFYEGKQMAIGLTPFEQDPSGTNPGWRALAGSEFRTPMSPAVVFPQLMTGRYKVYLLAPGSAKWTSDEIVLSDKPLSLNVNLQPGADLKFEIVAPGGPAANKEVVYEIKQGERPINYPYYDGLPKTYRGLPAGQYRLKVYSTAELRHKRELDALLRLGDPKESTPPMPPYEGFETTVIVDESSPALIDLGRITLPLAVATREAEVR